MLLLRGGTRKRQGSTRWLIAVINLLLFFFLLCKGSLSTHIRFRRGSSHTAPTIEMHDDRLFNIRRSSPSAYREGVRRSYGYCHANMLIYNITLYTHLLPGLFFASSSHPMFTVCEATTT